MKRCAGCRRRMFVRGGAIRVPAENEVGYNEFDICKSCAERFHKMEQEQEPVYNVDETTL